jgi:uncharacterized coiled-coil protein SlyX
VPENEDAQQEHAQRIESLELKLMDLENTVQQLNEVILTQYKDIERLQLQQQELLNRPTGGGLAEAIPNAIDELPPHY